MFVEIRGKGRKKKFYLVHTYRLGGKVKRISRYLGSDLDAITLKRLRENAERTLKEQLAGAVLETELSDDEIVYYRGFEDRIEINHLQNEDWKRFTEDFTYNTNAIEGSAVAYEEVVDLLGNEEIPESSDEKETVNVAKAVEYIRRAKGGLSIDLIRKLHRICFDKTKPFAGKFRDVEVVIKDGRGNVLHEGAPACEIRRLLGELVEWYGRHSKKYPSLFLAAVVHNQFEKIHPFQDGNGRVGRLLLNYVLLRHKHPPVNIDLGDRKRYYDCLQEYDETGDVKPMLRFLVMQFRKTYRKR